jgi:NtrC-family two-component system response regulator AlgB
VPETAELEVNQTQFLSVPEDVVGTRIAVNIGEKRPRIFNGGDHSVEAIEREHILRVIARTATLDEAAAILGIDASTLWRKRKKIE